MSTFNTEARRTELADVTKNQLIDMLAPAGMDEKKLLVRRKHADLVDLVIQAEVAAQPIETVTNPASEPVAADELAPVAADAIGLEDLIDVPADTIDIPVELDVQPEVDEAAATAELANLDAPDASTEADPAPATPAAPVRTLTYPDTAITPQEKARWDLVFRNLGGWNGFSYVRDHLGTAMTRCAGTNLALLNGVVVRRDSDGQEFLVGRGVALKYLNVTIPPKPRGGKIKVGS